MTTLNNPSALEELMEFPCEFNLKVMGYNQPELINEVCAIVAANCNDFDPEGNVTTRESSTAKYLALTVMMRAESKAQLDLIYQALHNHPLVKMTL
jgi:putative lipoic acid-binding regulatory protein